MKGLRGEIQKAEESRATGLRLHGGGVIDGEGCREIVELLNRNARVRSLRIDGGMNTGNCVFSPHLSSPQTGKSVLRVLLPCVML